jgi:hypothetical protein
VGVLLANIAPGAPPTEADGKVASVVHLSKSRPSRTITIAGFAPSLAERQALYAIAERHQALIQIHSDAVPPHSWELLVLQEVDGTGAEPTGHAGPALACTASFIPLREAAVAEPARPTAADGRFGPGVSDRRHVRLSPSLEQPAGLLAQ